MCGIAGFFGGPREPEVAHGTAEAMAETLAHRGPDGAGVWVSKDGAVGFGHRRLAIQDLSTQGAQPMCSADGRWVICYNGEVYNHVELRTTLAGHRFRGHSDTETILELIAAIGIESTLPRLNGMFALAAFDRKEQVLYLARDRLGIKPLYVSSVPDGIVFASRPSAFFRYPGWHPALNRRVAQLYDLLGYVPTELSIFQNTRQLAPGSWESIGGAGERRRCRRYWSLIDHWGETSDEIVDPAEFGDLLEDSVRLRTLADVPVGAFLSGGLDSTAVVLALTRADTTVNSFSIGFADPRFDESAAARDTASALRCNHREATSTAEEARRLIPLLTEQHDEPFADVSAIPTYLVTRLARQDVKVVLTGDGGDELFRGYDRYTAASRTWSGISGLAGPVLWMLRHADAIPADLLDDVLAAAPFRLPGSLFSRIAKLGRIARGSDAAWPYLDTICAWPRPGFALADVDAQHAAEWWLGEWSAVAGVGAARQMQAVDIQTYLTSLLTKVDRATMWDGLEARVPMLDYRIVEYAGRLPVSDMVSNEWSKIPIRRYLSDAVPGGVLTRRKHGFGVPLGEWLRGPLREWASELLSKGSLLDGQLYSPSRVDRVWKEHLQQRKDWSAGLWQILMYQQWTRRWLHSGGP